MWTVWAGSKRENKEQNEARGRMRRLRGSKTTVQFLQRSVLSASCVVVCPRSVRADAMSMGIAVVCMRGLRLHRETPSKLIIGGGNFWNDFSTVFHDVLNDIVSRYWKVKLSEMKVSRLSWYKQSNGVMTEWARGLLEKPLYKWLKCVFHLSYTDSYTLHLQAVISGAAKSQRKIRVQVKRNFFFF